MFFFLKRYKARFISKLGKCYQNKIKTFHQQKSYMNTKHVLYIVCKEFVFEKVQSYRVLERDCEELL